jgi:hypothetical protein
MLLYMPWYSAYRSGDGEEIYYALGGNRCLGSVVREGSEVDQEFTPFVHSKLPPEQGKHDEILVKLTDDVNRLIKKAQRQKPDKRVGITRVPSGLFFHWLPNYHLPDNVDKVSITDDDVEKIFGLTK